MIAVTARTIPKTYASLAGSGFGAMCPLLARQIDAAMPDFRGASGKTCELRHTSAVVQKMQGGLELAINSRVGGRGKLPERIDWSKASSNIRAVWHSDELVVWNRPIAPGVHRSSAHLAVPRMPIAGRGLVIGDFIQRPTMGALEGLSHPPSIGAIVFCIHPARARMVPRHRF